MVESDNLELEKHTLLIFNNTDLHRIKRYKDGIFKRYVIQFRPEYIEQLRIDRIYLTTGEEYPPIYADWMGL